MDPMKRILMFVLSIGLLAFATEAWGQRITDSGFKTIAHIKSDGTVQDSSYRTIGHARDIPQKWVAVFFFFNNFK